VVEVIYLATTHWRVKLGFGQIGRKEEGLHQIYSSASGRRRVPGHVFWRVAIPIFRLCPIILALFIRGMIRMLNIIGSIVRSYL
jgi:hypothetical protein